MKKHDYAIHSFLTEKYNDYLSEYKLPKLSADELAFDLSRDGSLHYHVVNDFAHLWDLVYRDSDEDKAQARIRFHRIFNLERDAARKVIDDCYRNIGADFASWCHESVIMDVKETFYRYFFEDKEFCFNCYEKGEAIVVYEYTDDDRMHYELELNCSDLTMIRDNNEGNYDTDAYDFSLDDRTIDALLLRKFLANDRTFYAHHSGETHIWKDDDEVLKEFSFVLNAPEHSAALLVAADALYKELNLFCIDELEKNYLNDNYINKILDEAELEKDKHFTFAVNPQGHYFEIEGEFDYRKANCILFPTRKSMLEYVCETRHLEMDEIQGSEIYINTKDKIEISFNGCTTDLSEALKKACGCIVQSGEGAATCIEEYVRDYTL